MPQQTTGARVASFRPLKRAMVSMLAIGLGLPGAALAGTYRVGSGTEDGALPTVEAALSAAKGDAAAKILLPEGVFHLPAAFRPLDGMTIRGVGEKTTVIGTIVMADARKVTISDLTLAGAVEGQPAASARAMDVVDSSDITLTRVRITGYTQGAIRLERVARATIDECVFVRTTTNSYQLDGKTPASQSTAILLGDIEDVRILRTLIDTRVPGGRGIGSCKESWSADTPWADPPTAMTRLEIGHCTILVDQWHAWNVPGTNTHPPQMTIELWHTAPDSVEIHHNYLNNTVSLSSDRSAGKPLAARTVHMHHNRIELIPTGREYRYAVEPYVSRFEFDHNYVIRGVYPFATWGKQGKWEDQKIHHNVFYATGPAHALMNHLAEMPGLLFAHNTVYLTDRQRTALATFAAGDGRNLNQRVVNNLFISTVEQDQPLGFTLNVDHKGSNESAPWENTR